MKSMTYPKSVNGRYVLKRDGNELARGTELDVWSYIHQYHSFSVEHALRCEGFTIEPELRKLDLK